MYVQQQRKQRGSIVLLFSCVDWNIIPFLKDGKQKNGSPLFIPISNIICSKISCCLKLSGCEARLWNKD